METELVRLKYASRKGDVRLDWLLSAEDFLPSMAETPVDSYDNQTFWKAFDR